MRAKISDLRAEIERLKKLKVSAAKRAKTRLATEMAWERRCARVQEERHQAEIIRVKQAGEKAAREWERRWSDLLHEINLARARKYWKGPVPDERNGEMITSPEMLAARLTTLGLQIEDRQERESCLTH